MCSDRRRRYHRKTRGACKSCGTRHIRCDQEKPICRNCLKKGLECSNSHEEEIDSSENDPSQSMTQPNFIPRYWRREPSPELDQHLGKGMFDPLNSLPLALHHDSARLFDHFNNHRVLVRSVVRKPPGGDIFNFATSDPLLMHAAILLAINHFHLLQQLQAIPLKALFHHKGEAIRLINSRLAGAATATSPTTLGAVATMIILESSCGSPQTALQHLNGLESLLEMSGGLYSKNMTPLVQRMILLADLNATSVTNTKPRFRTSGAPTSKHPSYPNTGVKPPEALNQSTNRTVPIAEVIILPTNPPLLDKYDFDSTSTRILQDLHVLSLKVSKFTENSAADHTSVDEEIITAERFIDFALHAPVASTINGKTSNSVSFVQASNLYLYIFLRHIPLESPVYQWMIPIFKIDLTDTGRAAWIIFPPEVLFWVLFLAGLVVYDKPEGVWFQERLRDIVEKLGLNTWKEARTCLESVVWTFGDGEIENKSVSLWNEIMTKDRRLG